MNVYTLIWTIEAFSMSRLNHINQSVNALGYRCTAKAHAPTLEGWPHSVLHASIVSEGSQKCVQSISAHGWNSAVVFSKLTRCEQDGFLRFDRARDTSRCSSAESVDSAAQRARGYWADDSQLAQRPRSRLAGPCLSAFRRPTTQRIRCSLMSIFLAMRRSGLSTWHRQ